jgi:hypothetical protein
LILATPVDKSHPKLESPRPPSPEYVPNIILTLKRPVEVVHPSFLTPTFGMPFVLLLLGKLKMLYKSPNPFRTLPINLSVHKQSEMG